MCLEKHDATIKKQLSELKKEDKIVLYNNPSRFCKLFLERTNPTHIGYIWGIKTRKERRKHGKSIIRVAKVYFANQIFLFSENIKAYLIYFLDQMPNLTVSCFFFSFASAVLFYYMIFKLLKII